MLPRLLSSVLFVAILLMGTACARSSGLLKPGDKVGDMIVVNSTPDAVRYSDYCTLPAGTPDPMTPGTYQFDCQVPPGDPLWISDGWAAKDQQTLEDNWRAFDLEMYIDDRQVDTDAFGTIDEVLPDGNSNRTHNLALKNVTGKHIIRLVYHMKEDVFDGYGTYKAGTYDTFHNVTVKSE